MNWKLVNIFFPLIFRLESVFIVGSDVIFSLEFHLEPIIRFS